MIKNVGYLEISQWINKYLDRRVDEECRTSDGQRRWLFIEDIWRVVEQEKLPYISRKTGQEFPDYIPDEEAVRIIEELTRNSDNEELIVLMDDYLRSDTVFKINKGDIEAFAKKTEYYLFNSDCILLFDSGRAIGYHDGRLLYAHLPTH